MTRLRAARAVVLGSAVFAVAGCSEGAPAVPAVPVASTAADGGANAAEPGFAVCPPGIQPTFASLLTTMWSTPSCGTNVPGNCHSSSGASSTGNLLDYSLDAGAVYAELVGDGEGHPATNISGSDHAILRVAPFDAGGSLLYVKLMLGTTADPRFGAGMPLTAPGSVCPAALDAVEAWIDQGAKNN